MRTTTGWQSLDPTTNALTRVTIERRDLRPDDIAVRIDYCGVCHSDLHRIHGMLGEKNLVPGHEATGVVVATGEAVTGFAVGERVAIGTIIDSCGECAMCLAGQENYCYDRPTTTYGGTDRIDGTPTQGAYSREYVLREKFAFHLPDGLDPAAAAPLLCAGVSVWEPMRSAGVGPGSRVAIAGLGGLGHIAVKLAAALGAEVTVLSRSTAKETDARSLGARSLLVTTDDAQVAAARGRFDLILDTISADHELTPLISMLGLDGTLCVLGNPLLAGPKLWELGAGRKKLTSSGTGGLRQTVEMLEFCAEHGITADVETLPSSEVETALNRLAAGDVRYRFVLDLSDLDK
ncbi:putative zinc-type alcohol dehydrogenase-like protein [Thermocatellispora tengchongensis]|uniref:alcohol dehydrogenase (NADP(+)) n=1 Tax=Thermocatellispora tengchongensis TaxID=1073253 RepID=A0A840PDF3_9ACTN|nr:NAD(P)-dependent alcohol dehydrogenase [Thermocatellispora tengchongensis]MBB5136756.1 putative zinc-type alcohol dehydrogenase-like protein [Thermocatellispora tengchongensis]